jgi:hypothetical protein
MSTATVFNVANDALQEFEELFREYYALVHRTA